jgi:hypothetical protein
MLNMKTYLLSKIGGDTAENWPPKRSLISPSLKVIIGDTIVAA